MGRDTASGGIEAHMLRIIDRTSGKPLGTVATINADGFVVTLKQRINEGTVLELRIDLPSAAPELPIDLGAVSLWTTKASVSKSYWAAFQIIDISSEAQHRLDALLGRCHQAPPTSGP